MVGMLLLFFCCLHAATCEDYIPSLSNVGVGYDVLNGKYAQSDSVKKQLFDLDLEANRIEIVGEGRYLVPNTVEVHTDYGGEEFQAFGKSISQYHKSLSAHVGIDTSHLLFSTSTSVEYSQATFTRVSNAYARQQYNFGLYRLSLRGDIPTLRKMLLPEAQQAIDNMNPTDLFNAYGTHFVNGILVGGRLVYTMQTDQSAYHGKTSISVLAQARYSNAVFGTKITGDAQYNADMKAFQSCTVTMAKTIGGNPAFGNSNAVEDVKRWSATVEDYPEFVDFADDQSLIPINKLALTQERRDYLSEQYKVYCEANERVHVLAGPPYLYARKSTAYVFADDAGQKSRRDMTVTMPHTNTAGGWYAVTQKPFPYIGEPPAHQLLVVKAIPDVSPSRMVPIPNKNFTEIWRCGNWAYFRAKVSNPYYALTDVMVDPETNWYYTGTIVQDLAALHSECLEFSTIGDLIWNEYGQQCGATEEASTWEVAIGQDTHAFTTNPTSDSTKPSVNVWKIRSTCLWYNDDIPWG